MAIMTNASLYPAMTPGLARYGLFNAATIADDLDARGIASGFQLPAEDCGTVRPYDANCLTSPVKEFDEGLGYQEGEPYWLYATRQCGSVGHTPEEMQASVRRRLLAGEQRAVEAQVWGGGTSLAVGPQLTTLLGVTTVTPTAAGSGAAIAALEDAFYDTYGYVGTIHISMSAYANMTYGGLTVRNGGTLNTPVGSVWAIGAGYGIDGPEGAAPDAGSVWAFMTPPVLVRRSEVITPPAVATLDRTTNQYMSLAERVYAHTWACDSVFAVQVPVASPAVETGGV